MIERKKMGRELLPSSNTLPYLIKVKVGTLIAIESIKKYTDINSKKDSFQRQFFFEAKEIVESGFDTIYKSNTIIIYTLLEATIKDLIINLFKILSDEIIHIDDIKSVRVSLAEFNSLSEDERLQHLYNEYEKTVAQKTKSKYGFERFEALLKPFGLDDYSNKEKGRNITELAQIRNCLVHNNGLVDRNLLNSCGWLKMKYKMGDYLRVDNDEFIKYLESAASYLSSIEFKVMDILSRKGLLEDVTADLD